MNAQDVLLIEKVLLRLVSVKEWDKFLNSTEGEAFSQRLSLVRATLRAAGLMPTGVPPRPVAEHAAHAWLEKAANSTVDVSQGRPR